MTETLAHGYSFRSAQQELSNEYQHDKVQMFFKRSLCSCALDESSTSALEGLSHFYKYHGSIQDFLRITVCINVLIIATCP